MKSSIIAALVALAVGPLAQAQGFLNNCTWQTAMLVDSYLGAYCNNDNWEIYSYDWTCADEASGELTSQRAYLDQVGLPKSLGARFSNATKLPISVVDLAGACELPI
ncbi:hypothetical protein GGR58DRAFT_496615 [Xylaria digitata]|nr:hypothetical protein GGR58DRAFT_496615 [Xylaria digitata]